MTKNLILLFLFSLCTTSMFAFWSATAGPEGGNVYAIEKVGDELWAGTEGGLYISSDNGASWVRSPLVQPEDNVRTINVFPGEILLGVTHFEYDGSSTADAHLYCYRSTDGGGTFIQSDLPLFNWDGIIDNFYRVGNNLFCKSDNQWLKSTDNGNTWTDLIFPGIYAGAVAMDGARMVTSDYSAIWTSEDGGNNWTFVDSLPYIESLYLEGDLVIAGTLNDLFYRSTDFGLHWQVDTMNNYNFDAAALRRGNQGELWQPGNAIFQSFDDGKTWNTVSFSPTSFYGANDAFQEGTDYVAATYYGVFRTVNGSWVAQNNGLKISKISALRYNEQGRMIASTNAGTFRSDNSGANWQKLPSYDYNVGPNIYDDVVLQGDSMLVVSGSYIWYSYDAGQTWTNPFPNKYFSSANYFTRQNGKIFLPAYDSIYYTADFGKTWQGVGITAGYGFYDDIIVGNNEAFVVNNDGDIYRSTDNFNTWTNVHTLFSPGASNENRLLYFANRIYAFGRLETFYSADGGDTWQELIAEGLPTDQWGDPFQLTNFLAVDNLLFATIPFNGVYMSSDAGTHWEALNDGLENLRGRCLAFHNNRLYLGTSTGGVYQRDMEFLSVSGMIYNDLNNNGVQDPGEPPLPNIVVAAEPLHSYASSGSSGSYGLLSEAFADTLRAVANTPYATINPPQYVVNQAGGNYDFGVHYLPNIKDLCISATNSMVIRPGFASKITITAKNIGTTAVGPATVLLLLPDGLSFTDAYPVPTQSGDTLTWQIGMLAPFESGNIEVNVACATDLMIGQSLAITTFISPFEDDANLVNNQYTYREPVVGSYDPNDKRVRPENGITPTQITQGNRLEYTIRFENTGNYLADFVRIVDTLSPLADVASLEIIAASHPVTWSVRGSGIVEFTFPNIFLLPSSTGNGEGHGFIKYSIRCRPGTPLNADIRNTAYIFFDFNTPVQTNTTSTVVKNTVGTATLPDARLNLDIAPNPTSDYLFLTWSKPSQAGEVRLYTAEGKQVFRQRLTTPDRRVRLNLPSLPTGSYQLLWQGEDQVPVMRTVTIVH